MKTVGVRALKQNASAVVADASSGEVVTITDRGRPVAQLIPLPSGQIESLVAARRARAPKRSLRDLGDPPRAARGEQRLSTILAEMREDGRF